MSRHRALASCALMLLLMLSSGCGNKGPLYLPQDAGGDTQDRERR